MLKAILHGKAGRISTNAAERRNWRDIFHKNEDLLTATFFGRLSYLSLEGAEKVLSLLVGERSLSLGPIREVIFWPKLKNQNASASEAMKDRHYVEPDVLLLFEETLLMIEVKPPFGGDQTLGQWRAEVESLILQRKLEVEDIKVPENFYFLALGRNSHGYKKEVKELRTEFMDDGLEGVYAKEWDALCDGIRLLADTAQGSDRAVYTDWLKAFALFGLIETPLPFADLLELAKSFEGDWKLSLEAFEITGVESAQPLVDWQPLVSLSQRMKVEVRAWQ